MTAPQPFVELLDYTKGRCMGLYDACLLRVVDVSHCINVLRSPHQSINTALQSTPIHICVRDIS